MVKLKQARGRAKGMLTRIANTISQDTTKSEAKVKMSKCEEAWNKFEDAMVSLEELELSDEQAAEALGAECRNERILFEEKYYEAMTQLQTIIDDADEVQKNTLAQMNQANLNDTIHNPEVNTGQKKRLKKLPEIKLPEFNGDYTKWLFFKNTFEAIVHNDTELTNVEKHQFLVGVLKGEALKVIESFTISEENYTSAWDLLLNNYDNQMLIIETHLEELFKFPAISKDNKSESLRQLHFHIKTHIASLKSMKQPVQHWDTLLIHLAKKNLDFVEQRDWQEKMKTKKPENMPKLEEFTEFLTERAQSYMLLQNNKNKTSNANQKTGTRYKKSGNRVVMSTTQTNCDLCGGNHANYSCEDFLKRSVEDRKKMLKEKGQCLNCLKSGHIAKWCKSSKCKKCGRSHNTLLHVESESSTKDQIDEQGKSYYEEKGNTGTLHSSAHVSVNLAKEETSQILLSTALIDVKDRMGRKVTCRALLDPGSQSNLMTSDLCKKLGLQNTKKHIQILGIDRSRVESSKTTRVHVISKNGDFETEVECLVLPSITERLPQLEIQSSKINFPKGIQLADPMFNKPGNIDMLIGAGLYWKIIVGPPRNQIDGQPALQNTRVGWILGGEIYTSTSKLNPTCLKISNEQLSGQIERFWKQEVIPVTQYYTREEKLCEQHFSDTVSRDEKGRFVVRLPIKPEVILGDSKSHASKRLESLVKRLSKQPELKSAYAAFMEEYQRLGHMTLVEGKEKTDAAGSYFIPHQAVVRLESDTTKVRVVFDASARTSSGASLNDKLMTGPNLQRDLFHIILRFRSHKFVLTGDVEKMFRQILVHPDDRRLQLIMWKEEPSAPIQVYQLNTVTYGTASAPYHAMRCLNELANLHDINFPTAAKIIRDDFYMDDCLTGGDTLEEVTLLRRQLQHILLDGGMKLRKWRSNDKQVLEDLEVQCGEDSLLILNKEEACKTLGLLWDSTQDCLQFKVQLEKQTPKTKREVASKIAQVFDPLGLLGPVLIKGKMLMQHLWIDGLEWDHPLSMEHLSIWQDYCSSLEKINDIRIQRDFNPKNGDHTFDLVGFSDASEKAFGACVYAVYQTGEGQFSSNLICAKSRVAPLKTVSLPRLELEAATLLTQLVNKAACALKERVKQIKLWSDSTITLGWIKTEPRLLKTYVANRVAKIQEATEHFTWGHVPSSENPADLLSRGVSSAELETKTLWWNGPDWLGTPHQVPEHSAKPETQLPEMKITTVTLSVTFTENLIRRFSSFSRLCRVIVYCHRFIFNCKEKEKANRKIGPLMQEEIVKAEKDIIKKIQGETFAELRSCLESQRILPKRSAINSLSPFLDDDGLIKVGGRLRFAQLPEEQKHPVLLPANHHISKVIMEEEHRRLKHCPPEQLLHAVRLRYWPIGGRREARRVVMKCFKCFRFNPSVFDVRMGDLPKERVNIALRPFIATGVDYAGPILLRESRRRGRIPVHKAYVAVFTCFSTKAVHLELVSELTTEAFLAALQRFTARRGLCKQMFSDNGRNFVGAANALKDFQSFLEQESSNIASALSNQTIEWSFIPPRSPHFGGLWEAAVKMMKRHLLTETQGRMLTFEEACTILCDIEAVLNSRPLTPLPSDPNDFQVLTPAHFLFGDSLTQPVQQNLSQEPQNRLSHWQHLQKIRQRIWQRWQREYLQELQKRNKWQVSGPQVQVDSLVLLIEDNAPPLEWPRGRVVNIHPGRDGEVRVVTVRTANGTFTRSIKKVCLLPQEDN